MAVSEGLEPQYLIYTWETTTIIHTIVALWPLKLGFYFDFMSRKKKLRGQFCHHIAGTKSFWFSVISVRDNVQVSYTVSCVMVSKLAASHPSLTLLSKYDILRVTCSCDMNKVVFWISKVIGVVTRFPQWWWVLVSISFFLLWWWVFPALSKMFLLWSSSNSTLCWLQKKIGKKLTAPGIPRRSPIQVLTRPNPA